MDRRAARTVVPVPVMSIGAATVADSALAQVPRWVRRGLSPMGIARERPSPAGRLL
jgi:hypothetical protein